MVKWLRKHGVLAGRIAGVLASLVVVLSGLRALNSELPTFFNYWGGQVGAIPAIVVGVFGLLVAIFSRSRPKTAEGPKSRKRRARSRPAPPSSPFDDFRKW